MISSSLLIKILGCTVFIGMAIGIPTILSVGQEPKSESDNLEERPTFQEAPTTHSKNTDATESLKEQEKPSEEDSKISQEETNQTENIKNSTTQAVNSLESTAENLHELIPTPEKTPSIFNDWYTEIEKSPNEFLTKAKTQNWAGTFFAGVCYIETQDYDSKGAENPVIYIPVKKSTITNISSATAWNRGLIETDVSANFLKGDFPNTKYTEELTKIINDENLAFKKIAEDLLSLQTIYEKTMSIRLKNIDIKHQDDIYIWTYSCEENSFIRQ